MNAPTPSIGFDELVTLTGDRMGVFDVPCPLCAPLHNPRRRVLRIWRETASFIGYACARCDTKGWARDGTQARPSTERLAEIRREVAEREVAERAAGRRKSRRMWSWQRPITERTPPFRYLREAREYPGPIPATLGYLPPRETHHHHAMIAAIGLAQEPSDEHAEPGSLVIPIDAVVGVHLTLLMPDGAKAACDPNKIIVGKGSVGFPICLAPANDLLGLVIAEGIEDALSIHEGTGVGAWAAGCASRLPALATCVPTYLDTVTIAADDDPDGLRHAEHLRVRLKGRGLGVEMRVLGRTRVAA